MKKEKVVGEWDGEKIVRGLTLSERYAEDVCSVCNGTGIVYIQDGPDDFIPQRCLCVTSI